MTTERQVYLKAGREHNPYLPLSKHLRHAAHFGSDLVTRLPLLVRGQDQGGDQPSD